MALDTAVTSVAVLIDDADQFSARAAKRWSRRSRTS